MSNKLMLSASDRIAALLDDSSFVEVGAYVTARTTDFNTQDHETPADGVVTGYGTIDGRLVYVYSQDASVLKGAMSSTIPFIIFPLGFLEIKSIASLS